MLKSGQINISTDKINMNPEAKYFFRKAGLNDLERISKLHQEAFSAEHFTSHFSIQMLYEYFKVLIDSNEFNYVLYNPEKTELLGYIIAGSNSSAAIDKFVKKNIFKVFITLIKNPIFIIEKISGLVKKLFNLKQSKASIRIQILVTNPKFQGKGMGKYLLTCFEDELRNNKIYLYGLSVRKKNISAIKFYEKNSFLTEFTGGSSVYYIKYL